MTEMHPLEKARRCKPCFEIGYCLVCGCDFDEMVLTNKKYPDGKF